MLKEIENLNRKVENLMKEKTKADGQKEVWEARLQEGLAAYEKEYGVRLSAKSLKEVKKNLSEEISIVEKKTSEEFEKASKLVALIENGNIEDAWKMLGVDTSEVVEEDDVESEEILQSADSAIADIESDDDFFGESLEDDDEEDHTEEEEAVVVMSPPKEDTEEAESKIISFYDDDDDDDLITPAGGISMDDDDDEDDGFGGFGKILSGSKFEV